MAVVAYWVLLVAGLVCARPFAAPLGTGRSVLSRLPATTAATVLVGVPSLVQLLAAPGLLPALRRDWDAIGQGEVWRLLTSLVVQDGGWAGATFNLTTLVVVGSAAERVWGTRRWLLVALGSGIAAQFWGWVTQPVGGGNSVLVLGLAASLAALGVVRGVGPERAMGAAGLVAGAALLVVGDLHGGAAAVGALLGLVLVRRSPPVRLLD